MKYLVAGLIAVGAGLLSVYANPFLPAVGFLALGFVYLACRSPFNMALVFCLLLFTRVTDLIPALSGLQVAKVTALAAIGLWGLRKLIARDFSWAQSPFNRWLIALVVAVLASSFVGTHRAESLGTFQDIFVKIIIMYVLLLNLTNTPKRVVQLPLFMATVSGFIAVYSLHAWMTGTILVEGSRAAYIGALGDPNDLALVLFMFVPFLLESTLATPSTWKRVAFVVLLSLLGWCILATQSRGAFLGLCGALVVQFHDRGRLRIKLVLVPIATLILAAGLLLSGAGDRRSGAVGSSKIDESAQGRLDAWQAGKSMFFHNPLLGVGFDQFAANFDDYVINPVFWGRHETHNSYIKCIAETGILGFIPFMMLSFLSFRAAWHLRKRGIADDPLQRAVQRSLLPTWAGFTVMAFFLSQTWTWYFYILFAWTASSWRVWGTPIEAQLQVEAVKRKLRERSRRLLVL